MPLPVASLLGKPASLPTTPLLPGSKPLRGCPGRPNCGYQVKRNVHPCAGWLEGSGPMSIDVVDPPGDSGKANLETNLEEVRLKEQWILGMVHWAITYWKLIPFGGHQFPPQPPGRYSLCEIPSGCPCPLTGTRQVRTHCLRSPLVPALTP